jgi:SAM-dependent methyltransferase
MLVFALTIFTGAFLLFQVQPLIAKYILPWFGGGPGVWTTCMLFFQVLLLGGYAYAHLLSRWLKPRAQAVVHLALLVAALACLPIMPSGSWKPAGSESPVPRILVLLLATLGLPYFVLSATGPLMQQWFSRANPGRSPYRLYALSNAGSLLALISYPFLFEPLFTRKTQADLWAWGLGAFAVCCALCALQLWNAAPPTQHSTLNTQPPSLPPTQNLKLNTKNSTLPHALWLLLPACASTLLLATTNKMCQDVAVIPFLWVLPLALYLLSFILCFDSPRWYRRLPYTLALAMLSSAVCWALPQQNELPLLPVLAIYAASLFVCCMICHGELYRLRPEPDRLTLFYLLIATGGALGGLFVAILAPLLFDSYAEFAWGLFGCGLLLLIACARDPASLPGAGILAGRIARFQARNAGGSTAGLEVGDTAGLEACATTSNRQPAYAALIRRGWLAALGIGMVILGVALLRQSFQFNRTRVLMSRNFYGVLSVSEELRLSQDWHHFALFHGQTLHGLQFVHPIGATWPTAYYTDDSGVGLTVFALPKGDRRMGVVGLGVGTLAAYARTNDYLHFYEINPEVLRVATNRFTYLPHCKGKVEYTLGDARLSLEREPTQQFDLLVLDAFSGDGIPVHLLTREAFAVYARHLKTNGVIAVHISNQNLDLEPVLANAAREHNYHLAVIESNTTEPHPPWKLAASWVLLTRNRDLLDAPNIRRATRPPPAHPRRLRPWTDDFTSLFQILHPRPIETAAPAPQ